MQTSYTAAVEAASNAIKAVEDINARADVVKAELETANTLVNNTISMMQALQQQIVKLIDIIEGKQETSKDEDPFTSPAREAAE